MRPGSEFKVLSQAAIQSSCGFRRMEQAVGLRVFGKANCGANIRPTKKSPPTPRPNPPTGTSSHHTYLLAPDSLVHCIPIAEYLSSTMAKSARASRLKSNKTRLRRKVFGPVVDARTERLSQKLQDLAAQPKPETEKPQMDVDESKG